MTNANRIRSSTIEELGKFIIANVEKCEWCKPERYAKNDQWCFQHDCLNDCIIPWLNEEAKKEEIL